MGFDREKSKYMADKAFDRYYLRKLELAK